MIRMKNFTMHSAFLLALFFVAISGCATKGQTGALAGGGIGALAGQAIGRNTEATLIGAAVGTGIGYIIGNEMDKQHASEMTEARRSEDYTHSEVGPLAGTRWMLVDLNPEDYFSPYASKIIEFGPQGRVTTITTDPDGDVEVAKEYYRVVGDTLIINKPDYIINAEYSLTPDQLVLVAEDFRAVLKRIP